MMTPSIFKTTYRFNVIAIFCIVIGGYYYYAFFGLTTDIFLGIVSPLIGAYILLALGENIFILTTDRIIIKYPWRLFLRVYEIQLSELSKVELDIVSFQGSRFIYFYFSNGKKRKIFACTNPSAEEMRHLVELIKPRGIKIKFWD
ncbi:MAG TPA: hypothetical protein VE978_23625 [Chitinophagales bacterium]|nr:hypothetical protein [Chitinophagales bacterium]